MQYFKLSKITGLIFSLTMFLAASQTAFAVGTASGVNITNTARVDYLVGTDPRFETGSDVGFVVDNRVDLTVFNTDAGNNVNVTPGQADRVLTFTVTNTGNTTQGYLLTTATGTTDIPMANVRIFLDDGGTAGSWDPTDTEYTGGTNAGDLNPNGVIGTDDVMTIFIVADTDAGAADTDTDDFRLVAQTTTLSSTTVTTAAGSNTAAIVDVVFADAAGDSDALRDGQHSDAATYTVGSPSLALVKTVVSTVDEFGTAFSIPNAVVNYQLAVTNSGSGAVDNDTVIVTDPIPANTRLCITTTASCTAPSFVDGATTSALTAVAFEYSFVAGGTACDDASFIATAPTVALDGTDAAVTCVRQQPTGAMAGSGGTFDIRFYVIIN